MRLYYMYSLSTPSWPYSSIPFKYYTTMAKTQGQVRFLRRLDKWTAEKPFFIFSQPDRDENPANLTNLEFQTELLEITDIRGQEGDFKLDECGFKVVHHPPALVDFTTLDDVAQYQKDVQSILTTLFNAEHVLVWDFKVFSPANSLAYLTKLCPETQNTPRQ
jgi:hypothetical protein